MKKVGSSVATPLDDFQYPCSQKKDVHRRMVSERSRQGALPCLATQSSSAECLVATLRGWKRHFLSQLLVRLCFSAWSHAVETIASSQIRHLRASALDRLLAVANGRAENACLLAAHTVWLGRVIEGRSAERASRRADLAESKLQRLHGIVWKLLRHRSLQRICLAWHDIVMVSRLRAQVNRLSSMWLDNRCGLRGTAPVLARGVVW